MADIFQASDDQSVVRAENTVAENTVAEDTVAEPISIRKLDRLETPRKVSYGG